MQTAYADIELIIATDEMNGSRSAPPSMNFPQIQDGHRFHSPSVVALNLRENLGGKSSRLAMLQGRGQLVPATAERKATLSTKWRHAVAAPGADIFPP
ncbi:hypothetical protein LBMAG56_03180 [Verrucomicrobiota bacterium]|nr:hypothetical protein LBMAG56_03180 [Verrucomicrobiota bacterium]